MKNTLYAYCIAVFVFAIATPAYPAIIFEDNFNRSTGNIVGNDWIETEKHGDDVAIRKSTDDLFLQLRGTIPRNPDAAASHSASTIGFNNIELSFSWAPLTVSEDDDRLFASWRPASSASWIELVSGGYGLGGDTSFTDVSFSLSLLASNISELQFRFWTSVKESANNENGTDKLKDKTSVEGARINWVQLKGEQITSVSNNVIAVPEPASLALLGIGLAGFIGLRYHKLT
jgi:hypothetical protein